MRKILWFFPLLVMLSSCSGDQNPNSNNNDSLIIGCDGGPYFSVSPLDSTHYNGLAPLGNLNPTGHTFPTNHHYFNIINSDGVGAPDEVPVYMPGDGWIVTVSTSEHLNASPAPYTDYALEFKPCSTYTASFGHMFSLSTELQNAIAGADANCFSYSTGGEDFRECEYDMEYFISAGTPVGTTGGREGQWALDYGAQDMDQTPLQWANQSRIENYASDLPYTACMSDAFEPAIKTELESRYSNFDGSKKRTVAPLCGHIDQDIAGTAQGIWFEQGTTGFYPEDPHLALVHDNVDPTQGVFSIGTALSDLSGVSHSFTPQNSGQTDQDFSQVTADGNIYCYPYTSGRILLTMPGASQLSLAYDASGDCSSIPTTMPAGTVSYVR
jgi:hypothetical protein